MHQPNIILCLCDQFRAFDVGCYGSTVACTPNIDRLAANGLRFEHGITNAPVCVPARSVLLSGQYARTCTGSPTNDAYAPPRPERSRLPQPLLPEVLREHGYETALVGKWHMYPDPHIVGFDHAVFPARIPHRYYGQTYSETGRDDYVIEGFGPKYEMDRVRDFLARDHDKPFFLYYNIGLPHSPIGAANLPEKYHGMYDPASVPIRGNVLPEEQPEDPEFWFKVLTIWDYFHRWAEGHEERPSDTLPPGYDLRRLTADYLAATTCVDDLVGDLTEAVSANGLAEDTIVLFLSDHGSNLGSHGRYGKDCLYEESIRVPITASWPGSVPGNAVADFASLVDVAPSLLATVGIEVPQHMQGAAMDLTKPVAAQPSAPTETFIEAFDWGREFIGIRTPTHMYGVELDLDTKEMRPPPEYFYDLVADPLQMNNLAAEAAEHPVGRELDRRLRAWDRETPRLEVPRE